MQDSTTTEPPATPRYVQVANFCGVLGVVLLSLFIFHAALTTAVNLPAVPIHVTALWVLAIGVLGTVKVGQWSADRATLRVQTLVDQRHAEIMQRLDRITSDALQSAHDAGQWKGVAQTLRETNSHDSGEIPTIVGRRIGGR